MGKIIGEYGTPFSPSKPFPTWSNNNFTIDFDLITNSDAYYLYDHSGNEPIMAAYIIYNHEEYHIQNYNPHNLADLVTGSVFIRALQVNPDYLRQGLASQCLSKVFDLYPQHLHTLISVDDVKAQELYTKHGFRWWAHHRFGALLMKSPLDLNVIYQRMFPYIWPIALTSLESMEKRGEEILCVTVPETLKYYEQGIKNIQSFE